MRIDVSNVVKSRNGNGSGWAAGLVEVQVYAGSCSTGGATSIIARNSGKCLDVEDQSTGNGA